MALLKPLSPRWRCEGLVNSLRSFPTEGGALLRLPESEAARISRANLSHKRLCRRRPRQVNITCNRISISHVDSWTCHIQVYVRWIVYTAKWTAFEGIRNVFGIAIVFDPMLIYPIDNFPA